MTININSFAQTPVRGELDLRIAKAGVIAGVLSASVVGSVKAGDFVKLDSTATAAGVPQFLPAAVGEAALGQVVRSVKAGSFVAGEGIEVAGLFGPVMFVAASAAVAPGDALESSAPGTMAPLAAGVRRGIALDAASGSGVLFRMIMINPVLS